MLKESIITFLKNSGKVLVDKSPEILLGVAIFGSVSSVAMAIKVTPEAEILIKEELERMSEEQNIDISEIKLKWTDYVKICWKVYMFTGIMLTTSIVAMILSNYIRAKRAGALATAFAITQETLRTYQDKVIEEVGKKKAEKIRDEVAKEELKKHDNDGSTIILTGLGNYLFYDSFSNNYFRSTIEDVKRAQNELNAIINRNIYANVNEFYDLLNLDRCDAGDILGWNGELVDINFSTQISDKDHNQEPCIVIDFHDTPPRSNYMSLH